MRMKGINENQPHFEETKTSNPEWIFVDSPGRKVFRMGDKVIKFGTGVGIREAQTMEFIKKFTSIPVPNIISYGPETLVMDYVEGHNLEEKWEKMLPDEKQAIAKQLGHIIHQLRGLKSTYIGSIQYGPAIDMRRSTYIGGPFESEVVFNEFLLSNMISSTPRQFKESLRQTIKANHDIVFTHADLNLQNIIIRDGNIVALLDWECAGWYPEYWEYVKFCAASCHEGEWHNLGDIVFQITYPEELIKDQYYATFVF